MDVNSDILDIIRSKLKSNVSIDGNDEVSSLDLDSLDILEIHMELEEKFGVVIDVEQFISCAKIKDIFTLLDSNNG